MTLMFCQWYQSLSFLNTELLVHNYAFYINVVNSQPSVSACPLPYHQLAEVILSLCFLVLLSWLQWSSVQSQDLFQQHLSDESDDLCSVSYNVMVPKILMYSDHEHIADMNRDAA